MRIKKHPNKNQYLRTQDGMWVRNHTLSNTTPIDINHLTRPSDYGALLENELQNAARGFPQIDGQDFFHPKVLILGDGHDFASHHRICAKLPQDVTILAVNGALAKWELVGPGCPPGEKRAISYYVVNNPYPECLSFLPRRTRYYPKCLASSRTCPEFLARYEAHRGTIYRYRPTPEEAFAGAAPVTLWTIDDYRNPVCAALGMAHRFGAERIGLLCCDDSFAEQRPGATLLENGLYSYPQHRISHGIVEGMLHWMASQKDVTLDLADSSAGPKYTSAPYITPRRLVDFFKG